MRRLRASLGLTSVGIALLLASCAGSEDNQLGGSAGELRRCASKKLTEAEVATANAKADRLAPDSTVEDRQPGSVTIRVYAHVIYKGGAASAAAEGMLTRAQVLEQIDALNKAYSGSAGGRNTAYRFTVVNAETDIDYTNNASWYAVLPGTAVETEMKSALHRGGRADLNLYFANPGDGLLGWSTFPWTLDEEPRAQNLLMDGVVILNESRPHGSAVPYDEGDTAVHEIGHWLGLLHTFQGECDGQDDFTKKGDYVKDTPREAGPTFGCPAPKSVDTCPSSPVRPDPVENYMDYTDDACMFAFTHGQALRANKYFKAFREGDITPPPPGDPCGDGTKDPDEKCDTAIPHGQPGACPTVADCNDGMTCTTDEVIGTACQQECFNGAITEPHDGDGCCPAGGNAGNDNDCAASCGDGVVSGGETCDTGIHSGPGQCPTACDDGNSCTTDELTHAGTCQAACVYTDKGHGGGDGCCHPGDDNGDDPDCAVVCGDGVVSAGETCDTGISSGPGKCPTSCNDGDVCTNDTLNGGGTCQAECVYTDKGHGGGDGCCHAGDDHNDDPDCAAPDPTAFRISEMYLRDPHVFVVLGSCQDLTNGDVGSLSVNGQLNAQLQRDGNGDGFFDMSPVLVFRPLAQHDDTTGGDFMLGHCSFGASSTCSQNGADVYEGVANNQESGVCVASLAGTTSGYSPAIAVPTNQCFATTPQTLPINIQGTTITLHDATIGAVYQNDPATGLMTGLIRGFVTETDADNTIVPLPLLGDTPLSKLLPGGKDNCKTGSSDKDTLSDGTKGWYFYLNFSAVKTPWTE